MKNLIRSAKYFLALSVFCVVLIVVQAASGMSVLSVEQTFYVMFHTWRGAMLPVAVVLAAAFYPRFGFMTRRTAGDIVRHREQVVSAFGVAGFSLCKETGGVMTFRAAGFVKRLTMLFEDEIRVEQSGGDIVMSGNRRGVARAYYQLDSYIRNIERNED